MKEGQRTCGLRTQRTQPGHKKILCVPFKQGIDIDLCSTTLSLKNDRETGAIIYHVKTIASDTCETPSIAYVVSKGSYGVVAPRGSAAISINMQAKEYALLSEERDSRRHYKYSGSSITLHITSAVLDSQMSTEKDQQTSHAYKPLQQELAECATEEFINEQFVINHSYQILSFDPEFTYSEYPAAETAILDKDVDALCAHMISEDIAWRERYAKPLCFAALHGELIMVEAILTRAAELAASDKRRYPH
eukprot:11568-Heterococcus_DN1.PRE.3